jgi:hypothetical protein
MKILKYFLPIMVSTLALLSCNKDEPKKETPGYFVITELTNSESSSLKSTKSTSTSSFDFGDLKASKEFFFLLMNGGDKPIFNISLSTDNSQFSIRPTQVNKLSGGILLNNAVNTGIIPILTLGITHGINLNGVGYVDLLPMGANVSVLTITGQTIDNGDTIEISNSFDISVNAKVMDIELYEGSDKINMENRTGYAALPIGGLGFVSYYSIYDSSMISIKNTGNVDIDLYYGNVEAQDNHILISQSDSVSFKPSDSYAVIVLDGNGTITRYSKIPIGDDGKGYFCLIKDNHDLEAAKNVYNQMP